MENVRCFNSRQCNISIDYLWTNDYKYEIKEHVFLMIFSKEIWNIMITSICPIHMLLMNDQYGI